MTSPKPHRPIRRGITRVLEEIRWERYHQIDQGWTPEHDDSHLHGELEFMASSRISTATQTAVPAAARRKLLIQAIAQLVAAVEAMDRRAAR